MRFLPGLCFVLALTLSQCLVPALGFSLSSQNVNSARRCRSSSTALQGFKKPADKGGLDKDMLKAQKMVAKQAEQKVKKTQRKVEAAIERKRERREKERNAQSTAPVPTQHLTQKTIWGQNIINCRTFKVDEAKTFNFLGSFKSNEAIPIYPVPEIAFIGRSNVGKSSLLNTLTSGNKKIAIQSKTPGCTQSINIFSCSDKVGEICNFVDLPGYGYAKMSKQMQDEVSQFLRTYLQDRGSLRLAVLLVDMRRDVQTLDMEMISFLREVGIPHIVIATKSDKMKKGESSVALKSLARGLGIAPRLPIPFSSVSGSGRREVWRAIRGGILGDSSLVIMDEDDDDDEYDDDGEAYDADSLIYDNEDDEGDTQFRMVSDEEEQEVYQ
jgi:GTP-binding protein